MQKRIGREDRLRSLARDVLLAPDADQRDLATKYGVTQQQISKDLKELQERYRQEATQDTAERVGRQLEVYDAIKIAHLPFALEGKTRNAEIVMQALAGESKLLGMDRPMKQEISLDGGVRVEIVGMAEEELP